jgi:molecular chaperone GrpE
MADEKTIPVNEERNGGNNPDFEELELTDDELRVLCKDRVCVECPEKTQTEEERLRSMAEMENFRKRMAREQEEFRKYCNENVLADLLPVLDNLELALEHGMNVEACKDLTMGVEMTRKVFLDILKKHGLERVGGSGEEFSPECHEAVGQEEREDLDEGTVCQILQHGYRLNGRLIRPAKVIVSKNVS